MKKIEYNFNKNRNPSVFPFNYNVNILMINLFFLLCFGQFFHHVCSFFSESLQGSSYNYVLIECTHEVGTLDVIYLVSFLEF